MVYKDIFMSYNDLRNSYVSFSLNLGIFGRSNWNRSYASKRTEPPSIVGIAIDG